MARESSCYEFELFMRYKMACHSYKLIKLRKKDFFETMKCGYENMADLNLTIAESGFSGDVISLGEYEEDLEKVRSSGEY